MDSHARKELSVYIYWDDYQENAKYVKPHQRQAIRGAVTIQI